MSNASVTLGSKELLPVASEWCLEIQGEMAAAAMYLAPSDYEGESGTAVIGRVVLSRMQQLTPREQKGKGKGGKNSSGKNGGKSATSKCELHVLGGDTLADMVYLEALADDAVALMNIAKRGSVIAITNARVIASPPKFSTSPLRYYLRVQGPLNLQTKVEILQHPPSPWDELPQHHPFVTVADLKHVEDHATVCLLGVVAAQPGIITRMTPYGEAAVCNATFRLETTTVRLSFWRKRAEMLSTHDVGSVVALYMVRVVKTDNSDWEVRAIESTLVEACPADLVETIQGNTDLQQAAEEVLTRPGRTVDYATTGATPACVSSLMALMVAGYPRKLEGVFEMHSVTILGLAPVISGGGYVMRCCQQCKWQIESDQPCAQHPDAATELRWIAKLTFSDDTGSGEAMIYHELFQQSGLGSETLESEVSQASKVAMDRKLRNNLWSMRLIYRLYEGQQQNYLEVKAMHPTLTSVGVVASWHLHPTVEVRQGSAVCLFSACSHVRYDKKLHRATVNGREILFARLWVSFLAVGEDEETATPDGTAGLRARRRIRCLVNPEDTKEYILTQSGLSSGVSRMLAATSDSKWLVLASYKDKEDVFVCCGRLSLSLSLFDYCKTTVDRYVRGTIDRGPSAQHPDAATELCWIAKLNFIDATARLLCFPLQ